MATSQFKIYTSSDFGGPGPLTGISGSLIAVLDACLVNGYVSHSAAGWIKPFPTTNSYTAYTQPSGSRMTFFINDNNPNVGVGREAQVTGWISLTSLSGSGTISSSNQGVGFGQFPIPSQGVGGASSVSGSVVWRKSSTADTTQRSWIVAADAWTVYVWMSTGEGYYAHGGFGEFFSLYGPTDQGKVMIFGKAIQNAATNNNNDGTDSLSAASFNGSFAQGTAMPGHFWARGPSGTGISTTFTKKGDMSLSSATVNFTTLMTRMDGILMCPNPTDGNFYFSPIWLMDNINNNLRGKYRGIFQICHLPSNFVDGQIITGGGTWAGKSFMVVKQGFNSAFWALEISNTVDTN